MHIHTLYFDFPTIMTPTQIAGASNLKKLTDLAKCLGWDDGRSAVEWQDFWGSLGVVSLGVQVQGQTFLNPLWIQLCPYHHI